MARSRTTSAMTDARTWTPLGVLFLATMIKLLLIPSYRSTDFEVHRNWLAVTSSRPLSQWYYEATSEWTLDYPPLFAWFEWTLGRIARLVLSAAVADGDTLAVVVDQYASASANTVLFQRLTVIASDLVLFVGIRDFCHTWPRTHHTEAEQSPFKRSLVTAVAFLNPGLLMVDHIHFQYNGFLLGLLLISISHIRAGRDVIGAATFAALLCFKHIFLYIAPVYFVYLLRHYCCLPSTTASKPSSTTAAASAASSSSSSPERRRGSSSSSSFATGEAGGGNRYRSASEEDEFLDIQRSNFSIVRFLLLGLVVGAVAGAAFAPFLLAPVPLPAPGLIHADGVLPSIAQVEAAGSVAAAVDAMGPMQRAGANGRQIIFRLFPFKRGLSHAYWAPNVWALYNLLDKILLKTPPGRRIAAAAEAAGKAPSLTGGLVEDASTTVLPAVRPGHTLILVLLAILPSLIALWRRPHPRAFVHTIVACSMGSFMLGWHVHEKAILISLVPVSLMAADTAKDARLFVFMSWVSQVSLAPLLFKSTEGPTKFLLMMLYGIATHSALSRFHADSQSKRHIQPVGVRLSPRQITYLMGLVAVYIFYAVVHPLLFRRVDPATGEVTERLPFLPLMLISTYTALGLIQCWFETHWSLYRRLSIINTYLPSPALGPTRPPGGKSARRAGIDDFLLQ